MKTLLNKIVSDNEKGFSTPLFIFIIALVGFAGYLVYSLFMR